MARISATQRLKGKVIAIAGGGSGTGKATATKVGLEGALVVVGDLDVERAIAVAKAITEAGGVAKPFQFDMGDEASVAALIDFTIQNFGRLDGMHNVAGNPRAHAGDEDVVTTSPSVWEAQLSSHLLAYATAAKIAIPAMLQNGGGAILNTSSMAARSALPNRVAYQASKAGVETLTRHIASRYGKSGIRCNAIAYGMILTENARGLPQKDQELALESTWSPRLGEPEDVAGLAALLLSDESSWINGQVIDVNGGRLSGP